jgi:hypothetical protein
MRFLTSALERFMVHILHRYMAHCLRANLGAQADLAIFT